MERSKRVQLLFAALLISTLAVSNSVITIDNQSSTFFDVFETTTASLVIALKPNGFQVQFPLSPPLNTTAAPVLPEFLVFFQYTTPPNSSTNTSGVTQEYCSLYVYDTATVTLTQKNTTDANVGFIINYPATS